jgi:hypothetical protein
LDEGVDRTRHYDRIRVEHEHQVTPARRYGSILVCSESATGVLRHHDHAGKIVSEHLD